MKYIAAYKPKDAENGWLVLNERMRKIDAIADCKNFIEHAKENNLGDYECTICKFHGAKSKVNEVVWDSSVDLK